MLSAPASRRLLALARQALESRVLGSPPPDRPDVLELGVPAAAFVSIHRDGSLCGCLGRLEPDRSLADVVVHLAAAVASDDPRFDPLSPAGLSGLTIEISVLGPAYEVRTAADVVIGRHGLIVEDGRQRGVLLPQVATAREWDAATFLARACEKAGLGPDAWRRGAQVFAFEADVYHEREADG